MNLRPNAETNIEAIANVPARRPVDIMDEYETEADEDRPFLQILIQYWHALRRRRWLVLGIIAASLIAGLVVTLMTPPQYTARAQIEISREQKRVTNVEGVEAEGAGRDAEFYQTQYNLLKANSLSERVARALRLKDREGFFDAHGAKPAAQPKAREAQAASLLRANLNISPIDKSRLVDVNYTSQSPTIAAEISNAWVREFIGASMDREFSSSADARRFLQERLNNLRARLEESERTAVNFASDNGIVSLGFTRDVEGKTQTERTLASADLEAAHQALTAARAERIAVQSRLTSATDLASPDVMQNSAVSTLRQRRAGLSADYSQLLQQYEPAYVGAVAMRERIAAIDREIQAEVARVAGARQQAYREAAKRERDLQTQFDQLRTESDRQRKATTQYNIYVRDADTTRQLYDSLLQRYKEIGVAGSIGANNIAIIDQADPPGAPSAPSMPRNLALALLLGLGLAAATVIGLEQIDEGIRGPGDVWRLLQTPLLGNVPIVDEDPRYILDDPKSHLSEAYFSIRSALAFSTNSGLPRSLCVTSSQPGEGKSTSSYALASIIGRTGKSVLLVDADLRSPSVHRYFAIPNEGGFSNLLAGEDDTANLIVESQLRGVSVLPTGPLPPSPSELLSSDRLGEVLDLLLTRFDHVIFDAPPVIGLADGPLIGRTVEGCLFIIEPGRAPVRGIRAALHRLRMVGATVLGAVVTKIDPSRQQYGYSYGYGYGYGNGYGYGYGRQAGDETVLGETARA